MTTAHGVLLFSRSLLVTGIAVFLAAGAHVTGGGGTPPAPLLAALTALLFPPVLLLSRRQLSLPVLASVLSAGQLLLHGAFSLSPPAAACTPTGPAGHIHHTMAATACAASPGRRTSGRSFRPRLAHDCSPCRGSSPHRAAARPRRKSTLATAGLAAPPGPDPGPRHTAGTNATPSYFLTLPGSGQQHGRLRPPAPRPPNPGQTLILILISDQSTG